MSPPTYEKKTKCPALDCNIPVKGSVKEHWYQWHEKMVCSFLCPVERCSKRLLTTFGLKQHLKNQHKVPVTRSDVQLRDVYLCEMRESNCFFDPKVRSRYSPPGLVAGSRPIKEKPVCQEVVKRWLEDPGHESRRVIVRDTSRVSPVPPPVSTVVSSSALAAVVSSLPAIAAVESPFPAVSKTAVVSSRPAVSTPAVVSSLPAVLAPAVVPFLPAASQTAVVPISAASQTAVGSPPVAGSPVKPLVSVLDTTRVVCTAPGSETIWCHKRDAAEAELRVLNEHVKRVQKEQHEAKQRIVEIRDQRFKDAQKTIEDLRAGLGDDCSGTATQVKHLKNLDLSRSWVLVSTTDGQVELKVASKEIRKLAAQLPAANDEERL